ncbi:MAG: hypothetical protein K0U38_09295 [Epsilonproteobacteria bacterium]|nr:hypothetical protein [Campylobacterota bacterium]
MRYIILGLLLIMFTACGSSTTNSGAEEQVEKPASPSPKDSSKQPPSIPNI